jgi:riboflavin synthase
LFTGIVTHIGTVREVSGGSDRRLEIEPGFDCSNLPIGASVAHSGVCLTVVERTAGTYVVEASSETLARTTVAGWGKGTRVNLERSLRLGDELGGHLVFGHVDAVGRIERLEREGESWRCEIAVPQGLGPMLAVKGSVAVDGVSLTVTGAAGSGFAVMVIPHTFSVTTLGDRRPGDAVNIEIDMLARYVARQLEAKIGASPDAR